MTASTSCEEQPGLANLRGSIYIYMRAHCAPHNQNMNNTLLRLALLLGHIIANVVLVAWFTSYDITGSWLSFLVFVAAMMVLLFLFIRHLLLFIQFLKNRSR